MLERLKPHYLKLGPKRFVICATLVLIILDLLNSVYLRLYWLKRDISILFVKRMFEQSGEVMENFSTETIMEMKGFIDNTFYFFLLLVLLNNLFFYFFYLRKKLWAQGYVLFYALTAAIFSVTFVFDGAELGWVWFLYNLSTVFIYAYLYIGVKVLKHETTDFIPEHGN